MLKKFAVSKNGMKVLVDMESSHAITHFSKTPALVDVTKSLIQSLDLNNELIDMDHDIGYKIGLCDLVKTNNNDEIVYALRPNRKVYSRFVKNRLAETSSWVTVRLMKMGEDTYHLHTAFIGKQTPSFPGGNFMPKRSKEFWSNHALVWGNQDIVLGTEVTECPW